MLGMHLGRQVIPRTHRICLSYETTHRAARFVTKVREVRARVGADKSVCVFSGDAFSPSLISTVSKGAQMVPVLNSLDIDVALYVTHVYPPTRIIDHHHNEF